MEVRITSMQGIHMFSRDRTFQIIKCNPWSTRLCPHPTIIKKIKTYLELEGKLGPKTQSQSNQFRPPQPNTNPKVSQMRPKYLSLTTFAYNTFNTPNLENYSPYELTFGRKPKALLNLQSNPDIKVSRTFKEYYELLNKRIKYLWDILFNFKSKRLAMINKDRGFFQYKSGDLIYIISPLTSQLCMVSHKVAIKYVGPVVIYKIIDPHNYLLMTLHGKILRGVFEHERLKPAIIRTSQGNVQNLAELRKIMNTNLKLS